MSLSESEWTYFSDSASLELYSLSVSVYVTSSSLWHVIVYGTVSLETYGKYSEICLCCGSWNSPSNASSGISNPGELNVILKNAEEDQKNINQIQGFDDLKSNEEVRKVKKSIDDNVKFVRNLVEEKKIITIANPCRFNIIDFKRETIEEGFKCGEKAAVRFYKEHIVI